jgi:hypothetical protein
MRLSTFRFILLPVLLTLAAISAAAQAVPSPNLFSVSGNLANFTQGSPSVPAMIASAALQVTNRVSAGYEHIAVPATNARWELGVAAYTVQASDLIGSKLSSKLKFDISQVGVTFSAGAGKVLLPTANRIAETAGVHLSYPLMDGISLQLIGVDVLHGAGHTAFLTTNTTTAISTGINIYFGHR